MVDPLGTPVDVNYGVNPDYAAAEKKYGKEYADELRGLLGEMPSYMDKSPLSTKEEMEANRVRDRERQREYDRARALTNQARQVSINPAANVTTQRPPGGLMSPETKQATQYGPDTLTQRQPRSPAEIDAALDRMRAPTDYTPGAYSPVADTAIQTKAKQITDRLAQEASFIEPGAYTPPGGFFDTTEPLPGPAPEWAKSAKTRERELGEQLAMRQAPQVVAQPQPTTSTVPEGAYNPEGEFANRYQTARKETPSSVQDLRSRPNVTDISKGLPDISPELQRRQLEVAMQGKPRNLRPGAYESVADAMTRRMPGAVSDVQPGLDTLGDMPVPGMTAADIQAARQAKMQQEAQLERDRELQRARALSPSAIDPLNRSFTVTGTEPLPQERSPVRSPMADQGVLGVPGNTLAQFENYGISRRPQAPGPTPAQLAQQLAMRQRPQAATPPAPQRSNLDPIAEIERMVTANPEMFQEQFNRSAEALREAEPNRPPVRSTAELQRLQPASVNAMMPRQQPQPVAPGPTPAQLAQQLGMRAPPVGPNITQQDLMNDPTQLRQPELNRPPVRTAEELRELQKRSRLDQTPIAMPDITTPMGDLPQQAIPDFQGYYDPTPQARDEFEAGIPNLDDFPSLTMANPPSFAPGIPSTKKQGQLTREYADLLDQYNRALREKAHPEEFDIVTPKEKPKEPKKEVPAPAAPPKKQVAPAPKKEKLQKPPLDLLPKEWPPNQIRPPYQEGVPYLNPTYTFGVKGRPKGTKRAAHVGPWGQRALMALAGQLPGGFVFGPALRGFQGLGRLAAAGKLGGKMVDGQRVAPGGAYTEGMDHSYAHVGPQRDPYISVRGGRRGEMARREDERRAKLAAQLDNNTPIGDDFTISFLPDGTPIFTPKNGAVRP